MHRQTIVVDDFYRDPEAVRSLALRDQDFVHFADDAEPRDAVTRRSYFTASLVEQFEALVGEQIQFDVRTYEFGVFTWFLEHVDVARTVHFDDAAWSGLVYLVNNNNCKGGLGLYRHRASGLLGPPSTEQLAELGYSTIEEWKQCVYIPDKQRTEAWEQTGFIAMRFNRLVLLHGMQVFHRPTSSFGTTAANGRLVQRFFFDTHTERGQHANQGHRGRRLLQGS